MIIKYVIQKHKQLGKYVVWQETKTEHRYGNKNGYGNKGVFQGSKKECQECLEKLKGE